MLCGRTSKFLIASKDTLEHMKRNQLFGSRVTSFAVYRCMADEIDVSSDIAQSQYSQDSQYKMQQAAQAGNDLFYLNCKDIDVNKSLGLAIQNLIEILSTFQTMTDTHMWKSWAQKLFTNRGKTDDTSEFVAVANYCEFDDDTFDIVFSLFGPKWGYKLTIASK